jgi:hypothetical protein
MKFQSCFFISYDAVKINHADYLFYDSDITKSQLNFMTNKVQIIGIPTD